ncbi:class I SAM-dependent methyltransferase [Azohydromonas aeria]|uniref:class I SAM-dependent methyltransferase n=1 Tax=Azohydromonas aeria TaxID=2590212 RepID=UPI0012FB9D3C|nr:class I SAM-dependent methyltransferase [Azohydromonas aeria]
MLNVQILAKKVARMLAREGVAPLCRRALAQLRQQRQADAFDLEHGTETGGLEPLWKLDIDSPNARYGERYEATTAQELHAVLEFLNVPVRDYSFIDLGCGKGRTLIVAARFGFGRVVGVEFARELADTASANLARQALGNTAVLHADAAAYEFPPGGKVVYMYNPFSEEVLARVLENLREHGDGSLYIVYKSPRCAPLLDGCGFLKRHAHAPGAPHIEIWQGIAVNARLAAEKTA